MSLVGQLEATTRKYHDRELRKAIVWKNYFWNRLFKNSRTLSGGRSYTWPIEIGDDRGIQWITDYTILDRTPSETITQAELDWVFGNRAVVMSKQEISKNSGKEQILNLLSKKMAYTSRRLKKALSNAIWLGSGGNQPLGISSGTAAVPGTGGAISTLGQSHTAAYAGITRGTDDLQTTQDADVDKWWCNFSENVAGAITLDVLEKGLLAVAQSDVMTDMLVTSKTGFRLVYNIATPLQREPHQDAAKLGFKSMTIDGIPLIWDDAVPDVADERRIYGFHMDSLELNWLTGWKIKREPWHKPEDQHALVTDISMGFVFAVTMPRHHQVWYGITGE